MALHKEPYDLVYNDDGSLCVTLRNDDKPFEGVTSFAVEEGTTNLITNPRFANGDYSGWTAYTGGGSISIESIADLPGFVYAARLADTSTGDNVYLNQIYDFGTDVGGQAFTLSAYAKVLAGDGMDLYLDFLNSSGARLKAYTLRASSNVWQREVLTATAPSGTYKIKVWLYNGINAVGTSLVTGVQLEQKTFATSFVDGSRPNGKLTLPVSKNENMVISAWVKIHALNYTTDYAWGRIFSFESDNDAYRITVGYGISSGKFLVVANDNDNLSGIYTSHALSPGNWYFLVFIIDNDTYTLHVLGDFEETISLTQPVSYNFDHLNLGYRTTNGLDFLNGLISNLYIGKAKDSSGNLIWTDDYIKQLYQAKRPFSVPPKMPVM